MHPTTSHQIATLEAAELRRRADLRHAHGAARRSAAPRVPSSVRSSLVHAWAVLATAFRGA